MSSSNFYLSQPFEYQNDFKDLFRSLQKEIHTTARDHGFWTGLEGVFGEKIALIHSEISEALEVGRSLDPSKLDEHCPEFPNLAIELADAIIRIMDLAEMHHLDLAGAIIAKTEYNKSRPFKHGKKF